MNNKSLHKIFLLGGGDLEMQTIKDVLEEEHLTYFDAHLKWNNAYLSQYQNVLSARADDTSIMIYGIELVEDIVPPLNYVRVDHHNDYSDREASLLQVLEIVKHPVSRYHELVAANDTAYIPGMQKIHATADEIDAIRRQDRKCQGAQEYDEQCALASIKNHLTKQGSLTLVYTQTGFFSTITDRLFPFSNLVIHNDEEATYYGEKVGQLKEMFGTEVAHHKMYYGGHDGFFGIAKGALTPKELRDFINLLITIHQ